jgi:glyoxylase-like metal-dependent hydrolase (beta-lactamase superfamily II)
MMRTLPAYVLVAASFLAPAAAAMPQSTSDQHVDPNVVRVWPVQGRVYMLVGQTGNAAVQIGDDGILVVDSLTVGAGPSLVAAIRTLSDKPIRWIVNTHSHADHAGGNVAVATAGRYISSGNTRGGGGASILAFERALRRMDADTGTDAVAEGGRPTDSYFVRSKDLFFNGEAVQVLHQPAAHTDGDSLVVFRHSDVVVAGDVFTPQRYPVIDMGEGGSITGLIAGVNHILELTVPALNQEGGTMVIPGHGHLCDEADVSDYRDMVTIVRDRIQDLVRKRMTLAEVTAAKPTFDYDGVYATPEYSGDMFVATVYRSLTQAAATQLAAPATTATTATGATRK